MADVAKVREACARLTPPRPDAFRDELWGEIDLRERVAARRRRAFAIATVVVLIAAIAAAGVFALGKATASVVDKTVACAVPVQGGVPVFDVGGGVRGRTYYSNAWHMIPASAGVSIPPQLELVAVQSALEGFILDKNVCEPAQPVPFGHSGLSLDGVYRLGDLPAGPAKRCFAGNRIRIRLRITLSKDGKPVKAVLAVRGREPIAYVTWTPTRIAAYFSSDCRDSPY